MARYGNGISFIAGTLAPRRYEKVTHQYDYPEQGKTTIRFFSRDSVFLGGVIITYDGEGREIESLLISEDV